MISPSEEVKLQLKDYIQLLSFAYYIYSEIEENTQVQKQMKKVYNKFKKLNDNKRIYKKDISCLRWYLDSINTFDKRKIISEGRRVLNGK